MTRIDLAPTADASLDQLLVDIMLGRARAAWAEGMSIQGISGLALRVGVVNQMGPAPKEITRMGPGARMELASAGASLLSSGPEAFCRFLDSSVAHPDARTDSPNGAYGEIQRWLRRNVEPGMEQFRDQLLQHALRHLCCRREEVLFGHALLVAAGRTGSLGMRVDPPTISSLASELGCTWERICSVANIVSSGSFVALVKSAPIPQAIAELVRLRLDTAAPTRDMRAILSLSGPQLVRLLAVDDRDRIPKANPGGADLFDIASTRSFLDAAGKAPKWNSPPDHLLPLMEVYRVRRRWPDVVKAVRDGRVAVAGVLAGRTGLQALLVDPDSVLASLPLPAPETTSLSIFEAVTRLDLSSATVAALRRANILIYAPRHGFGRMTQGPTVASLTLFEREFITARALSRRLGRSVKWLSCTLASAGVVPVVCGGKDVQSVYSRAAVDGALSDYRLDKA